LEATIAVRGVAERLFLGKAAAAEAYPLAFGDAEVVAIFVGDSDGAGNAQGTVLSNLNVDVCHCISSVIALIPDRWAGRTMRYAGYRE
jgi:class 3 adenylate cyclase